ncbi:uncharacterized protein TNCV_3071161 [Trichonephila clavipes]|nr:uncharacterized protein TNCV_3071161 [Trichonephila clavipes]
MGKKYLLTIAIPDYRPSVEIVELSSPVQHNASPDKDSRTTVTVSFLDVTGLKRGLDLSPNQNALRIASGTESTLIRKEDTTPLISCPVFLCSLHHSKRWRRWVTFNGMHRSGRWDDTSVLPCSSRPRTSTTNLSNSCTCGLERFQTRETTLLLIPKSAATLVTVRPSSSFPIILPRVKSSRCYQNCCRKSQLSFVIACGFSKDVGTYLNAPLRKRWIGRVEQFLDQPISQFMEPQLLFMGHLKNHVYATPLVSNEDLVARIS